MGNTYTYLEELHKQKQRLADILNTRGCSSSVSEPFASLVDRLESGTSIAKTIYFRSTANPVTLKVTGMGKIQLYVDNSLSQTVELTDEIAEVTLANTSGSSRLYRIDGADNIIGLDLHDCQIVDFVVSDARALKQLVLYGNSITRLDCSGCENLQFLHIFDNPLCDDDKYEANLIETISSLVDRTDTATGSVIFYPWYGLEKLICWDSATSKWIKYPNGHSELTLEDGRLYGAVDGTNITYYTYDANSGNLLEFNSMNRHHNLRKNTLEPISLNKNWVFGSAIMYDEEEWAKCPWDFRQNHIADMWETAEKGFGLTWGSVDLFTLIFPGADALNVVKFTDYNGSASDFSNPNNVNYSSFIAGSHNHGDAILSIVCGNGAKASTAPKLENVAVYKGSAHDQRYGYAPLCKLYLIDKVSNSTILAGNFATLAEDSSDCDTISCSSSYNPSSKTWDEAMNEFSAQRAKIYEFGKTRIVTACGANTGDGLNYTLEEHNRFTDAWFGNLSTDEAEGHSNTIFATALTADNTVANFSPTSPFSDMSKFDVMDYMAQYGNVINVYKNVLLDGELIGEIQYGSGTSYSTPMLSAVLMLMRIIYAKMHPDETSFGKFSPFMDHVRAHWCNRLPGQMDFAAGYGLPDIFAEPEPTSFLEEQPLLAGANVATLATPYRYVYRADASKEGFTLGHNLGELAVTRDNTIYPIRTTIVVPPKVYSNSARQHLEQVGTDGATESFYGANYYENEIMTDVTMVDKDSLEPLSSGGMALRSATISYPEAGTETLSVDRTSQDDGDIFTVCIAVDFTPDKMSNAVSNGCQDLMYFQYDNEKWGRFMVDGLTYTSSEETFDFSKAMFACRFYGDSGEEVADSMFMRFLDSFIDRYTKAVITVTSAIDGIHFYYNGNHVSFIPKDWPASLTLYNTYVNKTALVDATCAYYYNRVLTDDEIAINTAAILKMIDSGGDS